MRKITVALWIAPTLFVGFAAAFAQDEEPDGPAGDLPEEENVETEASDEADETEAAPVKGSPKGQDKGKKTGKGKGAGKGSGKGTGPSKPAGTTAADDEEDVATGSGSGADGWESFTSMGKSASVATEITKGVRVEDIVEPPSDYRYAAFGKPDPFVPPLLIEAEPPGPSALEIPLVSPLQRFQLEDLAVVGVWQLASGDRKAMILTPGNRGGNAGAGIIVKNGDLIGNRGGKILAIADDFLTVREFYLGADGTRQFEDRQLFMGKRNEEDLAGKIRFTPGQKQSQIIMEKDETVVTPEIGGGGEFDEAPLAGGRRGNAKKAQGAPEAAAKAIDPNVGQKVPGVGGNDAGGAGGQPAAAKAQFAPQGAAKPQFAPGGVAAEPVKANQPAGAAVPAGNAGAKQTF